MVEELGVGSWVAETRCGRSEGQVSLVYSVLGGSAGKERCGTYLVQALEHILEHARPLGAVAR